MFQQRLDDKQEKQAIEIALEARRMDVFKEAILESVSHVILLLIVNLFWVFKQIGAMFHYCLKVCLELLQQRLFRDVVFLQHLKESSIKVTELFLRNFLVYPAKP